MSINLYHGTPERDEGEELTCSDLVSGYDGMIHLHPDKNAVGNLYDSVVECNANTDLDQMPTLPDLRDWNPFSMAKELEARGIITAEEFARIEGSAPPDSYARQFDVEAIRGRAEERLGIQDEKSYSLRELVQDWGDDEEEDEDHGYDELDSAGVSTYNSSAQQNLDALNTIEDARTNLFVMLKARGITAIKYRNKYERELGDGYSVAVIDERALTNPVFVSTAGSPGGTAPPLNQREDVRAVDSALDSGDWDDDDYGWTPPSPEENKARMDSIRDAVNKRREQAQTSEAPQPSELESAVSEYKEHTAVIPPERRIATQETIGGLPPSPSAHNYGRRGRGGQEFRR